MLFFRPSQLYMCTITYPKRITFTYGSIALKNTEDGYARLQIQIIDERETSDLILTTLLFFVNPNGPHLNLFISICAVDQMLTFCC